MTKKQVIFRQLRSARNCWPLFRSGSQDEVSDPHGEERGNAARLEHTIWPWNAVSSVPKPQSTPLWHRPWIRRPAPDAVCVRRSCSRPAPPAPPCLPAPMDREPRTSPAGNSGSNFSPDGSNFLTPFFSSALSSERSVNSTPSISALRPGSAAAFASAGTASSARCRLSAISRTSRAKPVMP